MDPNHCDSNAECLNTNGNFYCICVPGFEGDGYYCSSQVNLTNGGSQESAVSILLLVGVFGTVGGVIIVMIVAIVVVTVFMKVRKRKKEQTDNQHQKTRYKRSMSVIG